MIAPQNLTKWLDLTKVCYCPIYYSLFLTSFSNPLDVAGSYSRIASALVSLSGNDTNSLEKLFTKTSDCLEKARRSEERVASDEDLKLTDTLRYWMRETSAAKVTTKLFFSSTWSDLFFIPPLRISYIVD